MTRIGKTLTIHAFRPPSPKRVSQHEQRNPATKWVAICLGIVCASSMFCRRIFPPSPRQPVTTIAATGCDHSWVVLRVRCHANDICAVRANDGGLEGDDNG